MSCRGRPGDFAYREMMVWAEFEARRKAHFIEAQCTNGAWRTACSRHWGPLYDGTDAEGKTLFRAEAFTPWNGKELCSICQDRNGTDGRSERALPVGYPLNQDWHLTWTQWESMTICRIQEALWQGDES